MSTVHVPELRWLHLEVQVKAAVPAFQKSIIVSHQGFGFLVDHETFKIYYCFPDLWNLNYTTEKIHIHDF
jgi:hypothetical protein